MLLATLSHYEQFISYASLPPYMSEGAFENKALEAIQAVYRDVEDLHTELKVSIKSNKGIDSVKMGKLKQIQGIIKQIKELISNTIHSKTKQTKLF